jgi:hypothetical protein
MTDYETIGNGSLKCWNLVIMFSPGYIQVGAIFKFSSHEFII